MKSVRVTHNGIEYNVQYFASLDSRLKDYVLSVTAWDVRNPRENMLVYRARITQDFIKNDISSNEDIDFIEDVFAEVIREHFASIVKLDGGGSIQNVNIWMTEAKEAIS